MRTHSYRGRTDGSISKPRLVGPFCCRLMPVAYGSFAHGPYRIEAMIPADITEPQQWTIRVLKDGVLLRQTHVPLEHEPLFGVDVEDVAALESATDALLDELAEPER